jgi:GT2 family glycosyltransferase
VSSTPAVSVIIVNYRSYTDLRACLTALTAGASNLPYDVIIVDQESDAAEASKIRSAFPAITLVPKSQNTGFAAGVNSGARVATGHHLLLLNPDTVVGPDLLPTLAGWLNTHRSVAIVGPRIFNADESLQPSARRFPGPTTGLGGRTGLLTRIAPGNWFSRRNLDWSRSSEPVDVDWVSGACMMIRRESFEMVGGMDEGFFLYWEDADLCRRLLLKGYRTMYVPMVSATHVGSRASRHAPARSLVAFDRSAFRYYWKHSGLVGRACAPIVRALLWGRLAVKLALLKMQEHGTSGN